MKSLSHVWLSATPWTLAYQARPSMECSRQEYWSRLAFPSPEVTCSLLETILSPWITCVLWYAKYTFSSQEAVTLIPLWHQATYQATEHNSVQFNSVIQLCPVSSSMRPHGLQHARLPCSSPTLTACSNSCSSSQWCHPTISSSLVRFSSCLRSYIGYQGLKTTSAHDCFGYLGHFGISYKF